jgi:hypothetical protein
MMYDFFYFFIHHIFTLSHSVFLLPLPASLNDSKKNKWRIIVPGVGVLDQFHL